MIDQYVIMINDVPEEVCAPGTTQREADERAAALKSERLKKQYSGPFLHVWTRAVCVYRPERK
jgi:hypothetical protein